jgi:hypothetical protein
MGRRGGHGGGQGGGENGNRALHGLSPVKLDSRNPYWLTQIEAKPVPIAESRGLWWLTRRSGVPFVRHSDIFAPKLR